MKGQAVLFAKKGSDDWETPQTLFDVLRDEVLFGLDAAASAENRKVWDYLGPDHPDEARRDALREGISWASPSERAAWLNPPYSQVAAFVRKARQQQRLGVPVVMLLPARTDTRWFQDELYDAAQGTFRPGVEVRFLRGRLRFVGAKDSAPFPSMIAMLSPLHWRIA